MDPITRKEMYLAAAAGQDVALPKPVTREEMFLAKMAGQDVSVPAPITRMEMFLNAAAENAGGGAASVPEKDVNFYDYDGTCLYAYSVEEAQALTELPKLPEREGLICQGWNWSLEDIKAHNRAVDVGAMYITDDGKTRIYITLQEGRTSPMLGVCPNGTVTVDWGDGTEPDVLTGTSISTVKWTPTHTYAAPGDYVIQLTVAGEMGLSGYSDATSGSYILRHTDGSDNRNRIYRNFIRRVEVGDSVTSIGNNAFSYCHSLSTITIPDSVTRINSNAFAGCYGVRFYDFSKCIAVPTLSNSNAFVSISADCEIRVPAALYDEWIAATNWATYASQIVAV